MNAIATKRIFTRYATIIFFLIFCILISIIEPRFLAVTNILNVFRQTSINAVIGTGMTLVILSGGIDLSVGSIFALSSAVGALCITLGFGAIPSIAITFAVGIICGFANGLMIARLKMQAFIATLVMMTFARGLTYLVTSGIPITMNSTNSGYQLFTFIGDGYLFNIPVPIFIVIILYGILYWVLSHTKYGRYLYAVGDNEKAATTVGIRVPHIKLWAYSFCGFTAALAGLILTSRLSSAPPTSGTGYELDAIAAVVLGGTSLNGGKGSILKTLMGALIISVLANSLNLLNVSAYYQMIVKAFVIFLAVISTKK